MGCVWVELLNPDIQFLVQYNIKERRPKLSIGACRPGGGLEFQGHAATAIREISFIQTRRPIIHSDSEPNLEIVTRLLNGERQVSV